MSGEDVDMDISKTFEFLDLDDEILMTISRSVPVDEGIFRFLANFNQKNKRLNTLVKFEMDTDERHRQEVGEIKYLFQGHGSHVVCSVRQNCQQHTPKQTF